MLHMRSSLIRSAISYHKPIFRKDESTYVKSTKDENVLDIEKRRSGIGVAKSKKLPNREPLVKNFFLGKVDKELLGFPEVIQREEMLQLQKEILPFKIYFDSERENDAISIMENVRELGLFGINVPRDFEGKGWDWSESLIATESEVNVTDVALALLSHRVVIDLLRESGTTEQQQRYFSKLANGSFVATEAIYESDAPTDDFFKTTAEQIPGSGTWILNGEKAFVVTGPLPSNAKHLFLVIAQTRRLNTTGNTGRGTTIFLVDSSLSGVKLGEKYSTLGCRGVQMRAVDFENVAVPESCIMGLPHEGNNVAGTILRSSRLRTSMIGLGLSKKLLGEMSKYCINNKQFGVAIKDLEITKAYLSRATCDIYAIESMIFMTAGLLDEFNQQDVEIEAAITKYFTINKSFVIASKYMDIIGPKSLHSNQPSELAFRDAAQLFTQGESIDTLRLSIALTGLQHAGVLLNDTIHKSRNPLFHPGHMFAKFLQSNSIENPKANMRLGDNIHPSLEPAAQCIEHSVARLQMCVDLMLTRYGSNVIERQNEILRLAEMVTHIYAMFASTSRASRSYCIGLQLADYELLTASTICHHGRDVIKALCIEIFNGEYVNNDINLNRLSKQVVSSKGYFPVHPLTYNF